jgi:hypothetical protein
MTDADLEAKLRQLMMHARVRCDSAPLIEAIWNLERAPNAGSVMALARSN